MEVERPLNFSQTDLQVFKDKSKLLLTCAVSEYPMIVSEEILIFLSPPFPSLFPLFGQKQQIAL